MCQWQERHVTATWINQLRCQTEDDITCQSVHWGHHTFAKTCSSRGVVDEARAKAYYEATWATIKDPTKLIQDKAEYCFTPEDAFVLEGSNNFDQEKLAEQKAAIEIHKTVPLPRQMQLRW